MKLNALAGFVVMFVLPLMPMTAWAAEESAANPSLLQAGERVTERLASLILQLPLIGVAIAIILGFYLLARWVGHWEQPFSRMRANRFIQNMVRQITQLVIVGIGILTALEILDATALVGAVLGAAGVVGLAIGFAFRDVVENYLAGILLSLRQPFRPNDHISIEGYEGKVIRLTSRATILLGFDGNHIRLPNATVFKSSMVNFSRNPLRRFDFVVGVGTGEDLHAAQTLGCETLSKMDSVLDDPEPVAILGEPGDSSIGIHFYAWVDQTTTNFVKAKSEAIRLVTAALARAEVDMPEPIHRVRLEPMSTLEGLALDSGQATTPAKEADSHTVVEAEQESQPDDSLDSQIAKERNATQADDLLDDSVPVE